MAKVTKSQARVGIYRGKEVGPHRGIIGHHRFFQETREVLVQKVTKSVRFIFVVKPTI